MGSWSRVTFDPGDRSIETVRGDVKALVADSIVTERYGTVVWQSPDDFDRERVPAFPVVADRIVVTWMSDTSDAGTGWLYEAHEGRYVLTDRYSSMESWHGDDLVDYFVREHGIVPFTRRYIGGDVP